jgi:hypothetical protein
MSHDRWEDSLDELCESPEEVAGLKETASLFSQLPETHYSSSFQEELNKNSFLRQQNKVSNGSVSGRLFLFWKGCESVTASLTFAGSCGGGSAALFSLLGVL